MVLMRMLMMLMMIWAVMMMRRRRVRMRMLVILMTPPRSWSMRLMCIFYVFSPASVLPVGLHDLVWV